MPPASLFLPGVSQPDPERRHVFISYSHDDRVWVDRLRRMMAPLLRGSGRELRLWDDSQIRAGRPWREAIEVALAEAKVALLLVSDAFLASEFVMGQEVPPLLAAAEAEGVLILWVSLSPSFVEETDIHRYQAVLPPNRHLEALGEVEAKEALKAIGQTIRQALNEPLASGREPMSAPATQPAGAVPLTTVPTSASVPVARAVQAKPAPPTAPAAPAPTAPPAPPASPASPAPPELASGLAETSFKVESARPLREGGGWRVERRTVDVRGFLEDLGEGVTLPMIQIPAGEFVMGSPGDEPERLDDEGPQHRVRLASFWLGQTPITQAQWRVVARMVAPLGQHWERELTPNPSHFGDGADSDQRPVEQVSWEDAMEFCRRLNSRLPPSAGRTFTLPSEAQWEYACRAGSTTPFAFGETLSPALANYDSTVSYANGPIGVKRGETTPVGRFPANAWGLYDMHGNVWEWCLDRWHDSYKRAPFDGGAWLSNEAQEPEVKRLLRGGSWDFHPRGCRSAFRYGYHPDNRFNGWGFRVCCLPQDSASLHLNL